MHPVDCTLQLLENHQHTHTTVTPPHLDNKTFSWYIYTVFVRRLSIQFLSTDNSCCMELVIAGFVECTQQQESKLIDQLLSIYIIYSLTEDNINIPHTVHPTYYLLTSTLLSLTATNISANIITSLVLLPAMQRLLIAYYYHLSDMPRTSF